MDYYKILKETLSPYRYNHSLEVSKQAQWLAPYLGADPEKAKLGGLLHDICKGMPLEVQLQYLKQHGILLDSKTLANKGVLHSVTGSVYLKENLGITDTEILSAVRFHTTGKPGMSPLELCVYIADYTSADRDYPDLEAVRQLLPHRPMTATLEGIRFGLMAALSKKAPLITIAVEAYDYYLEQAHYEEMNQNT